MTPTQNTPLFADAAQSVNTPPSRNGHRASSVSREGGKSKKVVALDSEIEKRPTSSTAPQRMHAENRAYGQYGLCEQRCGSQSEITEEDQEVRRESVDQHEYILSFNIYARTYSVRCCDVHNTRHWLDFGRFTEEQGHAFIDERVARSEGLKRD